MASPASVKPAIKATPSTRTKNILGGSPTVIVTIRDNRDYIRVLLYSNYTTITGWNMGVSENSGYLIGGPD